MRADSLRTLARGLQVLRYLGETGSDTRANIARSCDLSRPTTYRILHTLAERKVVSRQANGDIYSLTIAARQLSEGLTYEAWALCVATPYIFQLQQKIIWPTDLATLEDNAMVIRETTHLVSPWSIDGNMAGSRLSMIRSSVGRAYLSFCPASEREHIVNALRHSQDPENARAVLNGDIERIINQTLATGYARRLHEGNKKTCSIAVPLMYGERVLACMNVVWLSSAMTVEAAIRRYLPALKETKQTIEAGFRSTLPPALDRFSPRPNGERMTVAARSSVGSEILPCHAQ